MTIPVLIDWIFLSPHLIQQNWLESNDAEFLNVFLGLSGFQTGNHNSNICKPGKK